MFTAGRYLLTEQFRLNEQDLLALFERHSYDLVLLEGFGDSGWSQDRGGAQLGQPGEHHVQPTGHRRAMCRALILHWTILLLTSEDWIREPDAVPVTEVL